ncbi:MAG: hypothetical protein MUF54_21300, partial [Polyangiaceae bacterium]|nr:hypothetical protein [Polyangiaceae bacterium]
MIDDRQATELVARGAWVLVLALLVSMLLGCTKTGDSVVLAGDGTRLSSAEIDKDPLALLPPGAVALVHVDTQAAFRSQLGTSTAKLVQSVMPLGPEANFNVQRDVQRVVVGLYSLQGVDAVVVLQGSFDPDAIRAAASSPQPTAAVRLTRLEYANNDLFVVGDLGFVVVTKQTMVAGNETGIRRALDRIRDKRLRRDVPDWMAALIGDPKASIVGVADLSIDPVVGGAAQQTPFLQGLTVARVLGNFEPPGINFAGSLTYPDTDTAARASESLKQVGQLTSYMNLLAFFGIKPPIHNLQVRSEQRDVQFIVSVDGQSVAQLMDWGI